MIGEDPAMIAGKRAAKTSTVCSFDGAQLTKRQTIMFQPTSLSPKLNARATQIYRPSFTELPTALARWWSGIKPFFIKLYSSRLLIPNDSRGLDQMTVGWETLALHEKLASRDICRGADPYVYFKDGQWHLLLHQGSDLDVSAYSVRSATRLAELASAPAIPLDLSVVSERRHQAWAGEVHLDRFLYVAVSDGNNINHRMHVFESIGSASGPWREVGPLKTCEDRWAIDLTVATIPLEEGEKTYAVWSGWEEAVDLQNVDLFASVIPQHIYIAEMLSPFAIGPRHRIASPGDAWCSSIASILEGPQSIVVDGEFKGLLVTGNASWTEKYSTRALRYLGGDPLASSSWRLAEEQLFCDGHGIGHGMLVEEEGQLYYVGHRKTSRAHGWDDRVVFYCPMDRQTFVGLSARKPETYVDSAAGSLT